MVRLREAAESQRFKCDEQVNHSREACNMCNIQLRELEEANRKATIAEKRRDEVILFYIIIAVSFIKFMVLCMYIFFLNLFSFGYSILVYPFQCFD